MILIFTLLNLTSAFGFFVAGATLIPRGCSMGRWVKTAWAITFLATGLSHLTFTWMVLFYPGSRIDGVLGSIWAMGIQVCTAVGLWGLLTAVYLRDGELTNPRP